VLLLFSGGAIEHGVLYSDSMYSDVQVAQTDAVLFTAARCSSDLCEVLCSMVEESGWMSCTGTRCRTLRRWVWFRVVV
jgi:hypothetical protein